MKEAQSNLCATCPGNCCSQNLVNVCGYDAWVIARVLHVKPTDFLAFADLQQEENPYNFQLDGSGKSYHLALNMNEWPDGSRRCIFGLNLPHGQFRCGIYSLRPAGCRSYPFSLAGDRLTIKPWALCPEGEWALGRHDIRSLRSQLGQSDMEFCIYSLLVAGWNERVSQQAHQKNLDFHPFINFVMDFYNRLEPAREDIPVNAWPDIWKRWQESAVNGVNPLEPNTMIQNPPLYWERWVNNIHRAVEATISLWFAHERTFEYCYA